MILLTHLTSIADPRRREGRRFDMPHLLLFTLLAIISGANSYRSIRRFMHVRLDWFKSLTGIDWPKAPSHTGLRKCLMKLDASLIEQALRQYATERQQNNSSNVGCRNRNESRHASAWTLPAHLTAALPEWSGIVCLVKIERYTDIFHPALKTWRRRDQTA